MQSMKENERVSLTDHSGLILCHADTDKKLFSASSPICSCMIAIPHDSLHYSLQRLVSEFLDGLSVFFSIHNPY